jgi:hypothetical protein
MAKLGNVNVRDIPEPIFRPFHRIARQLGGKKRLAVAGMAAFKVFVESSPEVQAEALRFAVGLNRQRLHEAAMQRESSQILAAAARRRKRLAPRPGEAAADVSVSRPPDRKRNRPADRPA